MGDEKADLNSYLESMRAKISLEDFLETHDPAKLDYTNKHPGITLYGTDGRELKGTDEEVRSASGALFRTIKDNPGNVDGLLEYAIWLGQWGCYNTAEYLCAQATNFSPRNPEGYSKLSAILLADSETASNPDEAEEKRKLANQSAERGAETYDEVSYRLWEALRSSLPPEERSEIPKPPALSTKYRKHQQGFHP